MSLQMVRFHFLWLSNIPLYVCTTSSLSNCQLAINGHLGCFHILAIVNKVAVNTEIRKSFRISVLVFLKYIPEVQLLGQKVVLFLIF